MRVRMFAVVLLFAFFSQYPARVVAQEPSIPVGAIDFYGYGGIDIDKLRAALPVHVGDSFSSYETERAMSFKIREVILKLTGKPAVAVANVAIENEYLIYIGLSGTTMKKFALNSQPQGSVQLPQRMVDLYNQKMEILPKSIAAGATDDDSNGYALSRFPELHDKELEDKGACPTEWGSDSRCSQECL